MKKLFHAVIVACACAQASLAVAQAYPARAIRMVVALAPGGGTDVTGRIVSQKLAEQLGVPVVVENRPGAGTIIGTEVVAKSAPDGYTLMTSSPELSINPSLQAKLPYDTVKDFVAIAQLTTGQYFLSTHPSVPVKNVKELIALAKAKVGRVTYGSSGNGSANHLGGVLFQHMTGTTLVHVPYKSSGQSSTALMSGEIDLLISSTSAAINPIKSGRLRGIAVTSGARTAVLPDTPTVAESGLPGYEVSNWYALVAPAATAPNIVARLNAETHKSLAAPDLRKRFLDLAADPQASTPQQLAAYNRSELAKWARAIKAAGIKPE